MAYKDTLVLQEAIEAAEHDDRLAPRPEREPPFKRPPRGPRSRRATRRAQALARLGIGEEVAVGERVDERGLAKTLAALDREPQQEALGLAAVRTRGVIGSRVQCAARAIGTRRGSRARVQPRRRRGARKH